MLMRWIEALRRRDVDRRKAQAHGHATADAVFRAAMRDYDAFAEVAAHVGKSAFPVGTARDSRGSAVPIRLAAEALAAHWLIQGGTGVGKTTFVTWLVMFCLWLGVPIGVIDCKAGFYEQAIRLAAALAYAMPLAARAAFIRRLGVFNPFGRALPPFNVCAELLGSAPEVQAYAVAAPLSSLFDGPATIHVDNILRYLVTLLIRARLTLVEAPLVLHDEMLRGILVERFGTDALKEFFFRTYPSLPRISTDALLGRLSAVLLPENVRLMLGADEMVDSVGMLQRGDPYFVFLGRGAGVPEDLVNVVASLFLQSLFDAAYASGDRHRPYLIVLDEFFHLLRAPVLAERFATALATLRSFRVHLALVMHEFLQAPPEIRSSLLTHADIIGVFRSSARNAEFFGDFLPDVAPELVEEALRRGDPPPSRRETRAHLLEQLQRLPNRELYWYDRRQPYRALRLRVPDVSEPHERLGISAAALDAFIVEERIDRGGLALPREILHQQIEARQERLRELVNPPIRVQTAPSPADVAQSAPASPSRRRKPQLG